MNGFFLGLCLLGAWLGKAGTGTVRLTVLYDNYPYNESLQAAWGFSCLVEVGERAILFDTGGSSDILLANMGTLGIDAARIENVVLSHIHGDHVGGLSGLLELNSSVKVYLPASFPKDFKERVRAHGAQVVEVRGPMKMLPGVWSTGEMGEALREQALVVQSPLGLVVITGCAHPGVVDMVERAKEITGESVHLVVGGFHMSGMSQTQIQKVIQALQRLGVERIAPCHCSGNLTRRLFHEAYGDDFYPAGAGWSIGLAADP
jgi:7,8-dihydropterin-6-yl-methyl-4-(beta-D-ribofuranosyl)aminobenzene 5'-phosphate synthase